MELSQFFKIVFHNTIIPCNLRLNVIKYNENMKIVFLARRFYPLIGGVEKHVLQLSKRLIEQGHKITVITQYPKSREEGGYLKESEVFQGINIIRIKSGADGFLLKFKIWREVLKIREVFESADVIHCHDVFYWYFPLRFLLPRKPVFTTFHGYESYPISKRAVIVRKASEKLSYGNICIGDFIKKWYGAKPDIVSYGAVDVPSESKKHNKVLKNGAVFIGRLDAQTGILDYVKAAEIIREKVRGFELIAAGDGEFIDKIKKNTKVLGFINNPEKLFLEFRFAFVSRYLSILEAMIHKRLVFALYDNPVKRDYLEMAPFSKYIIIESDPSKLAEKVSYYMRNPMEEKKLVEQGFKWVKNQTWDKLAQDYLKLWMKK